MASPKIDWRALLIAPLRLLAPWVAMVLVVSWAGYPGVICVTPVAWLLALRVGIDVVSRSQSAQPEQRLREAALAGALFGLLQGVMFGVLVLRVGEVRPDERAGAAALIGAVVVLGIVAGAGLSLFTGWQVERRQRASS